MNRPRTAAAQAFPVSALVVVLAACGSTTFTLAPGDGGPSEGGTAADAPRSHDAPTDRVSTSDGAKDASRDGSGDGATKMLTGTSTLVRNQTALKGIAVDATHLFWVSAENATGTLGTGSVWRARTDGTGASTLVGAQMAPLDIAVDATTLYWSVNASVAPSSGTEQCLVMSVAKVMDGALCLSKGIFATLRLALDEANVIVLAQAPGGGNPNVGYTPKLDLTGTYSSVETQGPSDAVGASENTIFVGDLYGPHVDACDIAPTPAFGQALCGGGGCGTGAIVDIVVDETAGNVFWVTSKGELISESYVTSGMPVVLGTVPGTPQRLARDPSYLFVTTVTSAGEGAVYAQPVAGGAPVVLSQGERSPFGVATDGINVYWTCGDGTIRATGVPM
jgi:hypothetical protein